MSSNFTFLQGEWPELFEAATKAESLTQADARASCFYARRTLELGVHWMFKHDRTLNVPYQENLSALIHEPTFRKGVGQALFTKAKLVKDLGNQAVHTSKHIRQYDAVTTVRELFHFLFWLARTYARQSKPANAITFDPALLGSEPPGGAKHTAEQLKDLEGKLKEKDEKLTELIAGKRELDEELKRLRAEIAEVKKANVAQPDTHNYSEDQTREYFIDLMLKEAGWNLDQQRDIEFEVSGMPNAEGKGFVDYVLWGDDGRPLGLVEAKRTRKDPHVGQQQAKLYADCLEKKFGQRPIIFYSNGYETWIWDDAQYPPRQVQGFYKKDELGLLIQRRATRKQLGKTAINKAIVERPYQERAIRKISEAFEKDHDRKALLVMATGAGKTRTVIALCDLLLRCNWAKRVLFLADRVALVNQAVNAFKAHLPDSSPVNLVTERGGEGRVYVSTYPTMMRLIDEMKGDERRFGPGHFDLVIIDEAHRSVYQKYRAIFEYFDSLLVGLTATPKGEIDYNTYSLFDLETGVPTDAYELKDAVRDGFLVPPKAVSVPLKFQREGIKYDDLSEEEKERWDALEWSEDGNVPDQVGAEAVNKWLFNEDTVDKVVEHLMTRGLKVAGGDRLGKTIIFAKNHDHAVYIQQRFDANYPSLKGEFARVIDFQITYAQSLIDSFSIPEKSPHIAISVDMLDTGIDVPEVVNLVFFKLVRSRTKFFQMLGRGTRLRPHLFGPDKHKEFFYVFDFCQNLEFFNQEAPETEGALQQSLTKKLFLRRLELHHSLNSDETKDAIQPHLQLRREIGEVLREEVAAMNVANFEVRAKRRYVERYAKPETWQEINLESYRELAEHVAGLPAELEPEDEEAKRFDLLLLNTQLAFLRAEPGFERLCNQMKELASFLEEKASIPMVHQQLPLILEVQTAEFWQDITVTVLENVRKRLRHLIKFIERQKRKSIYTDFRDEIGPETEIDVQEYAEAVNRKQFERKLMHFLKEHENHITLQKLKQNEPITATDLQELDRLLFETGGLSTREEFERIIGKQDRLGTFVRSLVGLDRAAAQKAFSKFLAGKTYNSNQIQFINYIIDHLTANGMMDPARLYESPYTDLSPAGLDGLFPDTEASGIIQVLKQIEQNAAA